jgi:hypothetical protein
LNEEAVVNLQNQVNKLAWKEYGKYFKNKTNDIETVIDSFKFNFEKTMNEGLSVTQHCMMTLEEYKGLQAGALKHCLKKVGKEV